MSPAAVSLVPVGPRWEERLAELLVSLREAGDERFFHPHPLTRAAAREVVAYRGGDAYFVLVRDGTVLGYGMLRGWDAGYAVPSLGMALHPSARGQGLGRAFLELLHDAARARGARQVRLKVYPENAPARALYERLGYVFSDLDAEQLVGFFDLRGDGSS